jgi:hypothetical protein
MDGGEGRGKAREYPESDDYDEDDDVGYDEDDDEDYAISSSKSSTKGRLETPRPPRGALTKRRRVEKKRFEE